MNELQGILGVFEPPPGGWERLRARRDSANRWAPSWLALATGAVSAVACLALIPWHPPVRMQLTGGRLIGERSLGVEVQLLEGGSAVAMPSADANVRVYLVKPADAAR